MISEGPSSPGKQLVHTKAPKFSAYTLFYSVELPLRHTPYVCKMYPEAKLKLAMS